MEQRRKELGQRIAAARTAKRWKQKQLAAAVHVEPLTVSRWERGQHSPDIDMLDKIAAALDRPLSYFIDDAMPPDGSPEDAEVKTLLGRVLEELQAARDDRAEQSTQLDEIAQRLGQLEAGPVRPARRKAG